MKESIKFSVVVPVFNSEKYLDECIRSVLNQTYKNFELILVNDGSEDNSALICDRYAQEYAFVKAFHKSNEGQIAARCYGIRQAKGDYIVFLDSDDMLEQKALQVLCENVVNYDADCVVYNWVRFCNGEFLDFPRETATQICESKRDIFKKILSNNKYNSLCIKCIKREAFEEIDYSRYFYIRHGEDLLQSIDVLGNCNKVVFIPEALYKYRVNMQSVSHSITHEKFTVDFTVRERVAAYLHEQKMFNDDDWRAYRTYCISLLMSTVLRIAKFDVAKERKIKLFDEIKSQNYYKDFIEKGSFQRKRLGVKALPFELFRAGYYRILLLCVGFMNRA